MINDVLLYFVDVLNVSHNVKVALREKMNTEMEYTGWIQSIPPYSVRMLENTNQKNSEYGHFSCSVAHIYLHT